MPPLKERWGLGKRGSRSERTYTPGVNLEVFLGVPQPFLLLRLSHHEEGVPDGGELVQLCSQAVTVCHDLTPESIVRHAAVQPESAERMMSPRRTQLARSPPRTSRINCPRGIVKEVRVPPGPSGSGGHCQVNTCWYFLFSTCDVPHYVRGTFNLFLSSRIVLYLNTDHLDLYVSLLVIPFRVGDVGRRYLQKMYLLLTIFNYKIPLDFSNFIL